ncbi:MAG: hypothetical protein ACYTKD_02325 [Planctomycetota bacterium]|jgi:hypothetical protein
MTRRKRVLFSAGVLLILAAIVLVWGIAADTPSASLSKVQERLLQNYAVAVMLHQMSNNGALPPLHSQGYLLSGPLSRGYRFQRSRLLTLPDGTTVVVDCWGNPCEGHFDSLTTGRLVSSGPDGRTGTEDDIAVPIVKLQGTPETASSSRIEPDAAGDSEGREE